VPQDLNPNPGTCSSLVIFIYWACERQGRVSYSKVGLDLLK